MTSDIAKADRINLMNAYKAEYQRVNGNEPSVFYKSGYYYVTSNHLGLTPRPFRKSELERAYTALSQRQS
jgi:hypothetical protein